MVMEPTDVRHGGSPSHHEEDPERHRWYDKDIHGDHVLHVVLYQGLPLPHPGQPHPEEAIGRTKPRARDGLLLHSQLMLECGNLELHGPACVEELSSKGEQSSDDG